MLSISIRPRAAPWLAIACPVIFVLAAVLMFHTAATAEDMMWADGASFALNGEFLRDYLAHGLGTNPIAFANAWFAHYPALTISLYPPIFPLAEAAVFSVFGFSHAAAVGTVTGFTALALFGAWRVARTALPAVPAAGAALLMLAAPEMAIWSREVVMDVPYLAFLLLAAWALLRHQASQSPRSLYVAVALTVAAAYTKQTAIFLAPAFALALFWDEGRPLVRKRATWFAWVGGLIGILPLAVFTVLHAPETIHIAVGEGTGEKAYARLSLAALLAYGRALPAMVGVIPLAGAAVWLALDGLKGEAGTAARRLARLMILWFAVDYLCVSVTADFEPRYALPLTVPPAMLTMLLVGRLPSPRAVTVASVALALGLFAWTVRAHPVIRVEGYGDVAQYILDQTKQDDVVLFHGMASKNFVLSVRTRQPEPKIRIVRAEKHLVSYRIMRDWGITDRDMSSADIERLIDELHPAFIVFQPNFWTDQPSIARLQGVLSAPRFRLTARFFITSEDPSRTATIFVYRVLARLPLEINPDAARAADAAERASNRP